MAEAGKELVVTRFADEELKGIASFEDAVKLLQASGEPIRSADEFGTGFDVLEDKGRLVGVPFIVVEWKVNASTDRSDGEGSPLLFVSFTCVTNSGDKFIVNDGSTGIKDQFLKYFGGEMAGKGFLVPKGLRRSDYTFINDKGGKENATTFYLSTSKA